MVRMIPIKNGSNQKEYILNAKWNLRSKEGNMKTLEKGKEITLTKGKVGSQEWWTNSF